MLVHVDLHTTFYRNTTMQLEKSTGSQTAQWCGSITASFVSHFNILIGTAQDWNSTRHFELAAGDKKQTAGDRKQVITAHSTLLPCGSLCALLCQPTCGLLTDSHRTHSLRGASAPKELVASAAQRSHNLLRMYNCACIAQEGRTTSPLTASLLVSIYHLLTASVTTVLKGVRKRGCSTEEDADCTD